MCEGVVEDAYTNVVFLYLQQTNTADMLDLAIEYIKDLQKQVEVCYKPTSITPMPV